MHTAGSSLKVSAKVLEGLLAYDEDLSPQPQLATAWSISPDGLEYQFRLRQGVTWHDGKDFTSADVATSILLMKQPHPRGRGTFSGVADVRTPDPRVFRWNSYGLAEIRLSADSRTPTTRPNFTPESN